MLDSPVSCRNTAGSAHLALWLQTGPPNLAVMWVGLYACKAGTLQTDPSPASTDLILLAPLNLPYSEFHELGISISLTVALSLSSLSSSTSHTDVYKWM